MDYLDELINSFINMVNFIITLLVVIIIAYVSYYILISILTRRRIAGSSLLEVVKDPVTLVTTTNGFLVVKTRNNAVYTYSEPVSIYLREIRPYTNIGYTVVVIGLILFTVVNIINVFTSLVIISTTLSFIVLITLIVTGTILLSIKTNSLYIESKTGSKTLFRKIKVDTNVVEQTILNYIQVKKSEKQEAGERTEDRGNYGE